LTSKHDIGALRKFVSYATSLAGDEKGEAQVFLDRLFLGFGHAGFHEAGAKLEFRVPKESQKGTAFADLVWKPTVLIEMKKRGENLAKHYRQAFDYWARLVPDRPRWVVLCNFDEFWIYDFENQMDTPLDKVKLTDLPEKWGPLAFLFIVKQEPVFGNDQQAVTRVAADLLAQCFKSVVARGVDRTLAQRFTLQMLTALFAEDIGLLERYFVTRLLEDCEKPSDTYDLLGQLFEEMNKPGKTAGGRFKGVDFFNGGLFSVPARLELQKNEIDLLRNAATENWSKVRPEIFGTLFEHSLETEERHAFGAHFTSAADIMKIVGPTIVTPWRELIENASTQRSLRRLRERMQQYKVLDPACGSGNFLYIAYRELKQLEVRIAERIKELSQRAETGQRAFGFVNAGQFFGIDSNAFAIELAKLTMSIARKLAVDELHINEPVLPLDNLDANFLKVDALVQPDGHRQDWPRVDVVIGNPPFLDARKITLEHGRGYTERLRAAYPEIPGRADYCVYWFRRAHDTVPERTQDRPEVGRVGLVGTNTVRQNYSREGGLEYVVDNNGVIIDAVASQVWSGDAAVNVSIVNWVKGDYAGPRILYEQVGDRRDSEWQREEVASITSALTSGVDVSKARDIAVVTAKKLCFEGQQPGHVGFRFGLEERDVLARGDAKINEIVFDYMNGNSLLSRSYRTDPEFIIDFGERNILEASAHPLALQLVKNKVLADWTENAAQELKDRGISTGEHQNRLKVWWRLKRRRGDMIEAISNLSRYIVCVRHTKRPIFEFLSSRVHPDSALTVFAFEDDYSFGILQSNVHWRWFLARCSSIKRDFRYTNETIFVAFPWPQKPSKAQVNAVALRARELRAVREKALKGMGGGLRALYKTLDLPGSNPLRDAHDALDAAVLEAYAFKPTDDILAQILALNSAIYAKPDARGPGIPRDLFPAQSLVSKDCIAPFETS
jgi:SAM-dependent methyltransferase